MSALAELARDGVIAWQGLPPVTRDELAAELGADVDVRSLDHLGGEAAMRASGTLAGSEAVLWWLPHSDDAVALVELRDPPWDTDALGEPDARLDTYVGDVAAPRAELVWPARGVAALLGRGGAVAMLRLFAPTTLEHYAGHLRPDLTPRRF